jgi:hypothetical protein
VLFTELLRVTVLAAAAVATGLALATLIAAQQTVAAPAMLIFTAAWWTVSFAIGLIAGARDPAAPGSPLSSLLSGARTQTDLPEGTPAQIVAQRLWPLAVFFLAAGALTARWPQIGAIGTGAALLCALWWRRRERAVAAIEDRDAARFYVEPGHAWRPLRLVRTPGMGSDRPLLRGKPPDPRPAERNGR